MSGLWTWEVTDVLPRIMPNLGAENNWIFYVFMAFVIGILIGGIVKGAAKLVLGIVMFSGFVVMVLLLMQRQDILTMIASIVFGVIMLVLSFLVKVGKSYPFPKR